MTKEFLLTIKTTHYTWWRHWQLRNAVSSNELYYLYAERKTDELKSSVVVFSFMLVFSPSEQYNECEKELFEQIIGIN